MIIQHFKSDIKKVISMRFITNVGLFVWVGFFIWLFGLQNSLPSYDFLIYGGIIYLLILVIFVIFTNYNLYLKPESILVSSTILGSLIKKEIKINNIDKIIFKAEWQETIAPQFKGTVMMFILTHLVLPLLIPVDYKWIKIYTKSGRKYTYYFFGLEYDQYDNEGTLFETMHLVLSRKGINVRWDKTDGVYFINPEDEK